MINRWEGHRRTLLIFRVLSLQAFRHLQHSLYSIVCIHSGTAACYACTIWVSVTGAANLSGFCCIRRHSRYCHLREKVIRSGTYIFWNYRPWVQILMRSSSSTIELVLAILSRAIIIFNKLYLLLEWLMSMDFAPKWQVVHQLYHSHPKKWNPFTIDTLNLQLM